MSWNAIQFSAALVLVLSAAGCANVEEDGPSPDGVYTLALPNDTLSSYATMRSRAAARADRLCPAGWTRLSENRNPSDLEWSIRCGAVIVVVPPSGTVTATAPPGKL
jgi:hypothetical protein